jgi:hypothetical protein
VAKRRGRVDVLGEVHKPRQHFSDKELTVFAMSHLIEIF